MDELARKLAEHERLLDSLLTRDQLVGAVIAAAERHAPSPGYRGCPDGCDICTALAALRAHDRAEEAMAGLARQ